MDKWIREELSNCLDCLVTDEMMKIIMSIKTDEEFDKYFNNLLDENNNVHRLFLLNCRRMLLSGKQGRYNEADLLNKSKQAKPIVESKNRSKRNKYSTLFTNEGKLAGETILLKGRRKCACQGMQHKLINNCIQCGRIVCAQEGSGPCLFCGESVHTNEEIARMTKQKKQQQEKLMKQQQELEEKLQIKNKQRQQQQRDLQQQKRKKEMQQKLYNKLQEPQQIQSIKEQQSSPKQESQKQRKLHQEQKNANNTVNKENAKYQRDTASPDSDTNANAEGLRKAIEQRDRLLEYDRNTEKRTTVIDDEQDYFQVNSIWLTDAEREKMRSLQDEIHDIKHGSRIKRKIKIDFAGREIPEDLPLDKIHEEKVLREVAGMTSSSSNTKWPQQQRGYSNLLLPPDLKVTKLVFNKSIDYCQTNSGTNGLELECKYNRVQDRELMEMQDMRQCISMHQPWASLLVTGIKKHEGRIWYSSHRGRLWIASTIKEPHQEEIEAMENFYRTYYNDPELKFPKCYPTSSLLGSVIVNDCLPQEEYRERFQNGESDSPYVFICSHPEPLRVIMPIQGGHKIYELPLKTHIAACKTLIRARANKSDVP